MKHIATILFFTLLSTSLFANHFSGGELRYEYVQSGNYYKLILTLYKTCETGAISLPVSSTITLESAYHNITRYKTLTKSSEDTLDIFCAGVNTTCTNSSATIPGYIIGVYTDTIHLNTKASDWKLTFANSTRNVGITNLSGASGNAFYIESFLNDSLHNNSAAILAGPPLNILNVNDTIRVPISAADNEGDSLVFELANPLGGTNLPIPYYSGYAVDTPFGAGGVCYIDSVNQVLVLKATSVGKYTIATKVSEYRDSVLVGYQMRDFTINCINGGSGLSNTGPLPTSNTALIYYTCPGKSNLITLNFTDTISDSVYITVTSPTLTGFNFNTTTTNGLGAGSATISWTTPVTVTPTTLPFFNIEVVAKDNHCALKGLNKYIVQVRMQECNKDSVWPGDANYDKVVDLYDPLAIAVAYNQTGNVRTAAGNNWSAHYSIDWNSSFYNNLNMKHADCNGDGIVDTADLNAVYANYNKIHAKPGSANKTTGIPYLTFDHTGIQPFAGKDVSIAITLGSSPSPLTDILGLASQISISGLSLSAPPTVTYNTSWIGDSTNAIQFKNDLSNTSFDWAFARRDQQTVSGYGTIATLHFKIPTTATVGQLVTLSHRIPRIIDINGIDILNYLAVEDTFYIRQDVAVKDIHDNAISHISLYPNPVTSTLYIGYEVEKERIIALQIADMTGKIVKTIHVNAQKGVNKTHIDAVTLANGVYILTLTALDSGEQQHMQWIKQ